MPAARASGANSPKRVKVSAMRALVFLRLKVSLAAVKIAMSRTPGVPRGVEPLAVGDQDRRARPRGTAQAAVDLVRARHLRDPLRRHEGAHLHHAQAGVE